MPCFRGLRPCGREGQSDARTRTQEPHVTSSDLRGYAIVACSCAEVRTATFQSSYASCLAFDSSTIRARSSARSLRRCSRVLRVSGFQSTPLIHPRRWHSRNRIVSTPTAAPCTAASQSGRCSPNAQFDSAATATHAATQSTKSQSQRRMAINARMIVTCAQRKASDEAGNEQKQGNDADRAAARNSAANLQGGPDLRRISASSGDSEEWSRGELNPSEIASRSSPVGFDAHGRSHESRQLDDVILAWPHLPPEARSSIATLARTLAGEAVAARRTATVGEPSPTAGASLMHRTPAGRSPGLAGGGGSLVTGTEPGEGSRRQGNAVTTGSAVGTRLPAGSEPVTGVDASEGVRSGCARDGGRVRGGDRGPAVTKSRPEGGVQ